MFWGTVSKFPTSYQKACWRFVRCRLSKRGFTVVLPSSFCAGSQSVRLLGHGPVLLIACWDAT